MARKEYFSSINKKEYLHEAMYYNSAPFNDNLDILIEEDTMEEDINNSEE